jgi:hypothetical protein
MKHRVLAMQFDVSQHSDPLVPVREYHQNGIGAAEIELNHAPAHQGLPGGC